MAIAETIQRPVGPLPLWGWAIVIGGSILVIRALRGSSGGVTDPGAGGASGGEQGEPGIQGEQGPEGPMGLTGPEGASGPQGEAGAQGEQGPAGPAGAAGVFPPGYTKLVNDILNWFQQYERSQAYKQFLRDKIDSGNLSGADLRKAKADLDKLNAPATGSGSVVKFTATYKSRVGENFYGLSYVNTTINALQAQLAKL